MKNYEMMQQQINDVAEIMKTMFTKEELEQMEKDFDKKLKELKDEEGAGDNKSN